MQLSQLAKHKMSCLLHLNFSSYSSEKNTHIDTKWLNSVSFDILYFLGYCGLLLPTDSHLHFTPCAVQFNSL